jgi:hypothetical protein
VPTQAPEVETAVGKNNKPAQNQGGALFIQKGAAKPNIR